MSYYYNSYRCVVGKQHKKTCVLRSLDPKCKMYLTMPPKARISPPCAVVLATNTTSQVPHLGEMRCCLDYQLPLISCWPDNSHIDVIGQFAPDQGRQAEVMLYNALIAATTRRALTGALKSDHVT